jgi:hypothetical protein
MTGLLRSIEDSFEFRTTVLKPFWDCDFRYPTLVEFFGFVQSGGIWEGVIGAVRTSIGGPTGSLPKGRMR